MHARAWTDNVLESHSGRSSSVCVKLFMLSAMRLNSLTGLGDHCITVVSSRLGVLGH